MNLQINLATRTYINTRQLNMVIGVLLLLLLGWSCLTLYSVYDNLTLTTELVEKTQTGRASSAAKLVPEKDYQQFLGKVQYANSLLRKRSFDWLQLLDQLEDVVPDGIALTAIQPGKGQSLTITGTARQFVNIQALMERLESSKKFVDVFLTTQSEAQLTTEHKGYAFTITCKAKLS